MYSIFFIFRNLISKEDSHLTSKALKKKICLKAVNHFRKYLLQNVLIIKRTNLRVCIENDLLIESGEGNGTPLQYSCLENPMDRGAWWAAVHGVAKGWTRLSYFTFTFHFHELEKEMATHSSVLAWRIPGTGEPGGLPSMGLHRVGHD